MPPVHYSSEEAERGLETMTAAAGPRTGPSMLRFKVHGMDCAEEVAALRRDLGSVASGEERLSFNILEGTMDIAPGHGALSPGTVRAAVARAGMRAEVLDGGARRLDEETFRERRGRVLLTAASGFFALSFVRESWSVARARHAVAALLDLAPPTARIQREDGTEEDVSLE